jgi:membrane protease YdiL (CAAX protease family)
MPDSVALPSPIVVVACGLLLAAVIGVWIRPRPFVWAVLAFAVVAGYVAQILHGPAALWFVLLALALWRYRDSAAGWIRLVSFGASVVLTLLLGMHLLPGFDNPLLVRDAVLSSHAAPYTLYFNFDKTIAGILLLSVGVNALPQPKQSPGSALRIAAPLMVANVLLVMLLSLAFGYVSWQPHWTSLFWLWAVANLFLTCFSEEAFFRGFIQREVAMRMTSSAHASAVSIGISALLFGLAHFAGAWTYVLLATAAGAGYAWVYDRTQRLELAMLAHFALNAVHFLLFTYPYRL